MRIQVTLIQRFTSQNLFEIPNIPGSRLGRPLQTFFSSVVVAVYLSKEKFVYAPDKTKLNKSEIKIEKVCPWKILRELRFKLKHTFHLNGTETKMLNILNPFSNIV